MKKIRCPKCNKPILDTIEVEVRGNSLYYPNREQFGYIVFPYWQSILSKKSKKYILGFNCRGCGRPFSKNMERKIYKWLKLKSMVKKLSQ